jgi:Tol biopolymer transport system component
VTVYAGPTAAFSSNAPVFWQETVQFTDESLPGDHSIVMWEWDFGDGNTSTEQNPSHVYQHTGSYVVTLRVTDEFGCTDVVEHPVIVERPPTRYICGFVRVEGTDAGLAGAVVTLEVRLDWWVTVGTYTTGPDGFFEFTYTGRMGMFRLTETNPEGYVSTRAVPVYWGEVLTPDQIRHNNPPTGELCPYIFYDELEPGGDCPSCPDWITFHTDRDQNWEIYRLDGDGLLNLSNDPATDMAPTRSPDAAWVAYQSNRHQNWDIFLVREDGENTMQLTSDQADDTDPNWSGECGVRRIAFQSNRDGQWEIYIINADGTGLQRVTDNDAADTDPFWSPESAAGKIAFQSDRNGNWDVYVVEVESGVETPLVTNDANDIDPIWSPDGASIAFLSDRDGQWEIYVVDVATGAETRLTFSEGTEKNAAWSPDSMWLAYQSDRDGQWEIYVSRADASRELRVTEIEYADEAPTWDCSSERLVFHTDRDGNQEIYGVNAFTGGNLVRMTDNPASDLAPMWMPSEEDASLTGVTPARGLTLAKGW